MRKFGFFWISYTDLMTSLFFIMLVLYIITFTILQSKQGVLQAQARQLEEIKNVQKAIENLDKKYDQFDPVNKRYKLDIDVNFRPNSSDIFDLPNNTRYALADAGINLFDKIKSIIDTSKTIDYLLIIEGNAQRSSNNWINSPDKGYELSYKRALALFNYWKDQKADFGSLGSQCEVIIAGSGYFSQSRDVQNEQINRRFTIQITSKVGKFLHEKEKTLTSQNKLVKTSFNNRLFN